MHSPEARNDEQNAHFQLAADYVLNTGRSIFLTGKAGTGKTTFLKHICRVTDKKTVVVAPTGVAAINAGGMTMHSFFQLPLGLFVPGAVNVTTSVPIANRHTLFKNLRLSQSKRELMQELELLIIDEVSMVRCDMLDATDVILRHVRKSATPFGGVQVLFIGDLFQLPPVAQSEEWAILNDFYESPFFFHANVLRQAPPLYIELQKIYRQNEVAYISLLNHIRNNEVTDEDIELLNERFRANMASEDRSITLTTHNYKADAINQEALRRLPGPVFSYTGIVEGDFSERSFPAEPTIHLKVGARVMFIRNDSSESRSYYNGKLATVTDLSEDRVEVQFEDGGLFEMKREVWHNIRYHYNREEDEIEQEPLGTFSQYPIRLAWAITIHKSQGLTFDQVVVDAGESFAAGQVYVALSRCTSLEGLVLRSRITRQQIATDERVLAHARQLVPIETLQQSFNEERLLFERQRLVRLFDTEKIHLALGAWLEELPGKKLPDLEGALSLARQLQTESRTLMDVAAKFRQQLEQLLAEAARMGNYQQAHERTEKAVAYFNQQLGAVLAEPLAEHLQSLKSKAKVKKYANHVRGLLAMIIKKREQIRAARLGEKQFYAGPVEEPRHLTPPPNSAKRERGQSAAESFALFRQHGNVEKVAEIRGLAVTTIEGHLAEFVLKGDLPVEQLVDAERIKWIEAAMGTASEASMADIRQRLGDEVSYGQIKAVLNWHEWKKKQHATD